MKKYIPREIEEKNQPFTSSLGLSGLPDIFFQGVIL